jgi:hypothetical protein
VWVCPGREGERKRGCVRCAGFVEPARIAVMGWRHVKMRHNAVDVGQLECTTEVRNARARRGKVGGGYFVTGGYKTSLYRKDGRSKPISLLFRDALALQKLWKDEK